MYKIIHAQTKKTVKEYTKFQQWLSLSDEIMGDFLKNSPYLPNIL